MRCCAGFWLAGVLWITNADDAGCRGGIGGLGCAELFVMRLLMKVRCWFKRHLFLTEMRDYTPDCFTILGTCYYCGKTYEKTFRR